MDVMTQLQPVEMWQRKTLVWTFLFQTKNPFSCLDNSISKVRKCSQEDKVLDCGSGDQSFSYSQTCTGFSERSQVNFLLSLHCNVTHVRLKMVIEVGKNK